MYALKLEITKELITTVRGTIYQNEKNADTLVFVLPRTYEEVDLADCTVLMRYVTPSGTGQSEEIEMDPIPYSEDYYRYRLKASTKFTKEVGYLTIWLTILSRDNAVVLETGEAKIPVLERKNIDDFMSDADKSKLDLLGEKVDKLQKEKADNLTYNRETRKLQLTADGTAIGNDVTIPSDIPIPGSGDSSWSDMTAPGGVSNEVWEDM